jgi:hypothetical protein
MRSARPRVEWKDRGEEVDDEPFGALAALPSWSACGSGRRAPGGRFWWEGWEGRRRREIFSISCSGASGKPGFSGTPRSRRDLGATIVCSCSPIPERRTKA